jgi:ABC-type sugar transport system ATPase subunit
LNKGRIEQQGTPLELYEAPTNKFVAGFLGQPKMNLIGIEALADKGGTALRLADKAIGVVAGTAKGAVTLGLRPDAIAIFATPRPDTVLGRIVVVEQLGASTLLHVQLAGVSDLVTVEWRGKAMHRSGDDIWLGLDLARGHLFGPDGGRLVL